MTIPPVVALEIGTTKVVAMVGELRDDGHMVVTGMGEQPSAGVRKSEVVDLMNAAACVRAALTLAEENAKVAVRQVHVAVSGGHIQSCRSSGSSPIRNPQGEVTRDDMDQVQEIARALNLPADREIIHSVRQHFTVDDMTGILNPEGLEATRLTLDMMLIHGIRSRIRATTKAAADVPVDVADSAFSGLCSALAVLTPEQKESGALVIDLGGGSTSYTVYCDSVPASAGALGVGGDHVTNDIAVAFNIPTARAEGLKREYGSATVEPSGAGRLIEIPPEVGFQGRAVEQRALHLVMNARLDEMLGTIRKRLDKEGLMHSIGAGVVLTGGGGYTANAASLAEKVFGLPCSIGKPRNVTGLAAATSGPEYATCSGLIVFAYKAMGEHRAKTLWDSSWDWLTGIVRGG